MSEPDDPHPDMRGCFRFIPPLLAGQADHPVGATFDCPECGRVYTRERPRGGLPMWRAARERRRRTVSH